VINPPINHKYGYYHQAIRETLPAQAQSWLDCAQQTSGSWWTHWGKWLTQYSGIKIDALDPSGLMQGVIEPAPGSYVKTKATDQE
jgi:polyhydroxyalkanoate synthase